MNIAVDENIPRRTVRALLALGHSVVDVRGTDEQGVPDSALWTIAQSRRSLLISTDKVFGDYWQEAHFGILIVRLRQPNGARIHDRVMLAMQDIPEAEWPGLLVIMRDHVRNMRRRSGADQGPQSA